MYKKETNYIYKFIFNELQNVLADKHRLNITFILAILFSITSCTLLVIFNFTLPQAIPNDHDGTISNYTLTPRPFLSPLFLLLLGIIFSIFSIIISLIFSGRLRKSPFIVFLSNIIITTIYFLVVVFLAFHGAFKDPTITMHDYFHEGERFAFLYSSSNLNEWFTNSILIHGPSLNLIPLSISKILFFTNQITGVRIVLIAEAFFSYIFIFFIVSNALQAINRNKKPIISTLIIFSILVIVNKPLFIVHSKDVFFFLTIALLFIFINNPFTKVGSIIALLIGIVIPISFLFTLNKAIYGLLYVVCVSSVFCFINRSIYKKLICYVLIGLSLSIIIIFYLFGLNSILSLVNIYIYWINESKFIWGYLPQSINTPEIFMAYYALILLIVVFSFSAFFLTFSSTKYSNSLVYFQTNAAKWALFILMIALLNDFSYRFYFGKILEASLLVFLTTIIIITSFILKFSSNPKNKIKIYLSSLILLFLSFGLLTIDTANKVKTVKVSLTKSDSEIITPSLWNAAKQISDITENQNCFYTLTSEGIWYHLLEKKSCSYFPILTYARSNTSQKKVINDLEFARPLFILFSNNSRTELIDGLSKTTVNQNVMKYVMLNYSPYQEFEGYWLWKRQKSEIDFKQKLDYLNADNTSYLNFSWDEFITGHVESINKDSVVYILFDYKPVSADILYSGSREWEVKIPINLITPETSRIDIVLQTQDNNFEKLRSYKINQKID
jgi:hypothetical protein